MSERNFLLNEETVLDKAPFKQDPDERHTGSNGCGRRMNVHLGILNRKQEKRDWSSWPPKELSSIQMFPTTTKLDFKSNPFAKNGDSFILSVRNLIPCTDQHHISTEWWSTPESRDSLGQFGCSLTCAFWQHIQMMRPFRFSVLPSSRTTI